MLVEFKKEGNQVIKTYTLYDKEMDILKYIQLNERIDFRELKYGVANPYDETGTYQFDECGDLIGQGFIEEHKDWLNCYVPTPLGKFILNDNS